MIFALTWQNVHLGETALYPDALKHMKGVKRGGSFRLKRKRKDRKIGKFPGEERMA